MSERAPDGTAFQIIGDGPPVVLIHGVGLNRMVWDGVLPGLTGLRLITYDLYGHGESVPAPQEVTLTLFAQQIIGLLDHLNIARAHIVGFSIGGMINRRLALDAPERVASLAILNSPHDRGAKAQAEVEARARTVGESGAMATMDAALQRWFTVEYLAKSTGSERVKEWRNQVDQASYAGAYWVLANGVRELIAPDPPITKPCLVMTCENDSGSTPAMSQAIAAEIAGSECQIVPGLKHLGLMERPDLFAPPVRKFLLKHQV